MTPEEAEKFINAHKRAKTVLTRIHDYVEKEAAKSLIEIDNPKHFAVDNWEYLMAWQGGYRTAMRIVQDLTRTK